MMEEYLNKKYEFRYNVVINRTIYRSKSKKSKNEPFALLNEYVFNSILRELRKKGIKTNIQGLKSLLMSDYVEKFDPFKEYFKNLPKWNGETDFIDKLSSTIDTTDNKLFKWAFKKWLVSMVSCAIDDKSTNQTILVLTGDQGIGKTTWTRNLIPEKLQAYFYSGNINPGNKDSSLMLSEKLLINMDELASYTHNQIESFKELITKEKVTERRAYGHFTEDYVRRASFIGSSNHNEILMDVTGNRRFLCFECESIDFNHKIGLDDVYSQAMFLLESKNFKSYFDKNDVKRLEENNKKFIQSSEAVEWIDKLFKIPKNNDEIEYMNATAILEYIKGKSGTYKRINVQEIGKIMKSKKYNRKKIKGMWKYEISIK